MASDTAVPSEDASSAPLKRTSVVFIGALPPPVTGMTAMTEVIVEALKKCTAVTCFNWSRGKPLKGWRWKMARLWGAVRSLVGLAVRGPARGATLYYPISSGSGLYYDLAIAALGRLLGYRIVLHHHTYAFDRRDWRIAALVRLAGQTGAHAVACEQMGQDFRARYGEHAPVLLVPPTIVSQQLEPVERRSHERFTLGFLSNLTHLKGVDDAIATFKLLADSRPIRLILAGPCMSAREQRLVDEALARWPSQVEYRGPVYGREKAQFYADIDVFLFPTRHPLESWGIVLTEALSTGCPVISRCRGCVPWIVRGGCGRVIDSEDHFAGEAAAQVAQWMDEPASYQAARSAASRRWEELNGDALRQLPAFVEQLCRRQ